MDLLSYKNIKDTFDELDADDPRREKIQEMVANFHFRNGKKQHDGSLGEIRITIKQLNDCLAYVAKWI